LGFQRFDGTKVDIVLAAVEEVVLSGSEWVKQDLTGKVERSFTLIPSLLTKGDIFLRRDPSSSMETFAKQF
jgi:hypothetical protein